MKIKSIKEVPYKGKVHDLTVENSHSYNVSGMGVHNSVCGSLVFYLISVTTIDPLKYDLYFQRFVSEARAGKPKNIDGELYLDGSLMCDVDLDIDYMRRHEVIEYLNQKFPNRTSKIVNLSTLTGKNLIKECGKIVAEKSEFEMNQVAELVPQIFGQVLDIEKVYNGEKDDKGEWKHKPVEEFVKWCDENPEVYKTALSLRDLIKNKSVHASGIVISYKELLETCPLELSSKKELVSGYDMKDITEFCIKLDVLGLKTLTVIDEVCKAVGIRMDDIDFEDPKIYAFFQDFKHSYGIFQLEAGTAEKVTRWIKPSNIEELSDVMAISRPGAMSSATLYMENKKKGYFDPIHEIFDPIFKKTHGVALYQEQLMKMSNAIGFNLDESEIIRRIVGKKDRDAAKEWENKISEKVKENKFPENLGTLLWDVLDKSKDYSFNKCLAVDSIVEKKGGYKMLFEIEKGDYIKAFNINTNKDHFVEVIDIVKGERELYEIEMEDGRKVKASLDHKFLCSDCVMRPLKEIIKNNLDIITD